MTSTKTKIVVIVPFRTGVYKDDTTLFCEGLRNYWNYDVVEVEAIVVDGKLLTREKFDQSKMIGAKLIWAPYEPLITIANYFGKKYNIPTCGHFEIIPPGLISLDEVEVAFLNSPTPERLPKKYKEVRQQAHEWSVCPLRTHLGPFHLTETEQLLGYKVKGELFIKPYPLDDVEMKKHVKKIKKKRQIVSISRLVPHKKIEHVIYALSKMDNPPEYVIIGTGPKEDEIKAYAKKLGVPIRLTGRISDEEKYKIIQESIVAVHLWAWLPVGECAFFKVPSIAYDKPSTRERLNNMPIYCLDNTLLCLRDIINTCVNTPEVAETLGKKAHEELMNNRTSIYPIKEASKRLSDIFDELIKK